MPLVACGDDGGGSDDTSTGPTTSTTENDSSSSGSSLTASESGSSSESDSGSSSGGSESGSSDETSSGSVDGSSSESGSNDSGGAGFQCGDALICAPESEYCQRQVSDVQGIPDSYQCLPLPDGCNDQISCECLADEPCGEFDLCEETQDGGVILSCPGG